MNDQPSPPRPSPEQFARDNAAWFDQQPRSIREQLAEFRRRKRAALGLPEPPPPPPGELVIDDITEDLLEMLGGRCVFLHVQDDAPPAGAAEQKPEPK